MILPPPRSTLFPYTTLFRSETTSSFPGNVGPAAGKRSPGRLSTLRGVKSTSESQRERHEGATWGLASTMTKSRRCAASWRPTASPAWPAPMTRTSCRSFLADPRDARVGELLERDRAAGELVVERYLHLGVEACLADAARSEAVLDVVDDLDDQRLVEPLELFGGLRAREDGVRDRRRGARADEVEPLLLHVRHPLHEVRLRLDHVLARHEEERRGFVGAGPLLRLARLVRVEEEDAHVVGEDLLRDRLERNDRVDAPRLESGVEDGVVAAERDELDVLVRIEAGLLEVDVPQSPRSGAGRGVADLPALEVLDRLHLVLQLAPHDEPEELLVVELDDRLERRAGEPRDGDVHERVEAELVLLGDHRLPQGAARADDELTELDVLRAEEVLRDRDEGREVELRRVDAREGHLVLGSRRCGRCRLRPGHRRRR